MTGSATRPLLAVAFGGIFVASLLYSIEQTATNQAYAYFDTRARLWEFALGSLLALALPYLKPGKILRVVLGWTGLAAMLSCGLLLTVDRSFPGFIALWPTLAAAAIIVAGQSGSRFGVDRFLTWKPLVALGDNSYALYLWHWPLLVLALAGDGDQRPEPGAGPGDRGHVHRARRAHHPVRGEAAARMALAAAPGLADRRRHRGVRRPAGRARCPYGRAN